MLTYRNLTQTELKTLGRELALSLKDRGSVIGLKGQLGAGKTTFVKAFAAALKIKHISSPTFVIAHEYPLGKKRLHHLDFYRLEHAKQLETLGLPEMFRDKNLVLIEWADKFPKILKQCNLIIEFKVKPGNKRDVTIKSQK